MVVRLFILVMVVLELKINDNAIEPSGDPSAVLQLMILTTQ